MYRGADLRYNLEITLEQAAHGFDTTIRVPSWDKCDTCHGGALLRAGLLLQPSDHRGWCCGGEL